MNINEMLLVCPVHQTVFIHSGKIALYFVTINVPFLSDVFYQIVFGCFYFDVAVVFFGCVSIMY